MMKTALLTVQLALLTLVGISQTNRYSFKETYEVEANPILFFRSVDSDISISASDGKQIIVHFIVKRNNKLLNIDMSELREYFQITTEVTEEGLKIETRSKEKNNLKDWKDRVTLDFEILAPPQTACLLNAVDGDLSIRGLNADQQCKTVDGDIEVQDIKGDITASGVDGDINAREITVVIALETTDGDLKLKNITGDVQMKTIDGDVMFYNLIGGIHCSVTDGDIEGMLTDLKAFCECSTADGDIHITLPVGSGFDVEMKGESLHPDLKGFDGYIEEKHIKGKVNGGGVPVKLSTSDGDIRLTFE